MLIDQRLQKTVNFYWTEMHWDVCL